MQDPRAPVVRNDPGSSPCCPLGQLALCRHAADAEIRDVQLDLTVRPRLHQDIRRLEVAVDDGRREPVRVPHATDNAPHDARDRLHRQLALIPIQLPKDKGGQVAAADKLILQAGHFRVQKRCAAATRCQGAGPAP